MARNTLHLSPFIAIHCHIHLFIWPPLFIPPRNLTAWQRWHNSITQFALYPGDDPVVDDVISDLRNLELTELYQHEGGTQLKIVYYLENDGRAMFKPMRYGRTEGGEKGR